MNEFGLNSGRRPIALVNPNTNPAVTARMLAIARRTAGPSFALEAFTAPFGAALITDETALGEAADAVLSLAQRLGDGYAGVIVAAFGDPGADRLAADLDIPVVGIAAAGLRAAAAGGRRFSVVTTTPALVGVIDRRVAALGLDAHYAGVFLTEGDAATLTADPERLECALGSAIERAIAAEGIEALVIGGGPLADAAIALAGRFPVVLVQPIPEAVRSIIETIEGSRRQPAG